MSVESGYWGRAICLRALVVIAIAALCPLANASINLTLQPVNAVADIGEVVEVRVYATSDSSSNQLLSAVQMILGWQTPYLQLLGNHQSGAVPLLVSGFPVGDPWGLNESNPPQNGVGMYQAFAPLGNPVAATPSGTLLTTLRFLALAPTPATPVDILPSAGSPVGHTIVFDGTTPNTNVTGVLMGTSITIIPAPGGIIALVLGGMVSRRRRGL